MFNLDLQKAVVLFTGSIQQRASITAEQAMPSIREIPDMGTVDVSTAEQVHVDLDERFIASTLVYTLPASEYITTFSNISIP